MKAHIFLLFCLLLITQLAADTAISGTISSSQTWTLAGSPYIITGSVTVNGPAQPIITIQAGVQVRFNAGAGIILGNANWNSERGGMVVNGSEASPVLFTANLDSPSPGWWNYIYTHTYTSPANSFNYAVFEYGGSGNTGMVNVLGGSPVFTNCVFRHSANYGIYHSGTAVSASVGSSSFQNNGSWPLFWNSQLVHQIGTDNTFSGNANQRILLRSNIIYAAETWSDKGIPLEMDSDLYLKNYQSTFSVEPGTVVLFRSGKRMYVGDANYYNDAGSIQASSAVFGAVDPVAGWNGIYGYYYTEPSLWDGCTIRDVASTAQGAATINSSNAVLAFSYCLFTNNATYGLYCNPGRNFSLANCTFTGNANTVALSAGDVQKLLAGNVYSGNTENRIHCLGGTISAAATWTTQATPIRVSQHIYFDTDGLHRLEMLSGVELQFDSGRYFYVGNPNYSTQQPQLQATGVTFRASDPSAGWMGLYFYAYSAPSELLNCTIRDVAAASGGAVYIASNSQATVQNCLFTANATYGLYCASGRNFALSGCSFSANAKTVGVYACDVQKLLSGNVYSGNTENRITCLGGLISAGATWTAQSTPILVAENIKFDSDGAHILTIPYGTVLEFAAAKYFDIGDPNYPSQKPSLRATGVTFRGAEPNPGYWTGLIFRVYGDPSLLSGCTIRDAGYGNVAAIRCYITNSTITGCNIANNLYIGIWLADNSMVALSGNTISTCGSYPLSLQVERLRALTGQNLFTGNTVDRVQVRAGQVFTSGTWRNPGVPLELSDHCYIRASGWPHIEIQPGTVVMLPHARGLYIGDPNYSTDRGSLSAEGVTFTRAEPSAVPLGLIFYQYATPGASHFTDCVFEYLQNSSFGAVYVNYNDPVFEGCIFRNNPGSGLYVTETGRATALNCQFLNNGSYPISATATSFDAVSGTGNYFSGNNPNRVLISGAILSQSYVWDNPSVPVEVSSSISIDTTGSQPLLKLNSGLVLLFRANTGLYVGNPSYSSNSGGLQADGATFSALSGVQGGWLGITFHPYASSDSYLSNCVVEYAGANGNIRVNNSPLAYIDGCIIRYGNYGVYVAGAGSNPSISKNYILNNGIGVYCASSANPLIGGSTGNANSFSGNTTYAVQNTTSSFNVNALYNWWGQESGPYHASLNPGGTGDPVSNYVDFNPWRATNIGDAPARFHLLSPANLSLLETLEPVLDWEEALDPSPGDVVTYTLEIAENPAFTLGLITVSGLAATVYHVPPAVLEDDASYYWRVSATDTQLQTTTSFESYWAFTTAVPEAPLPFSPVAPAFNGTVLFTSNLLSWEASADPDPGDQVTYTVYQDISAGFENAQTLQTPDTQAWSGFCAPGSLIYWKVKATDLTNNETFSPTWRFFVDWNAKPRAPVEFTLTPSGSDIQIAWDAVPGADSYDIYSASDPFTGFTLLQAGIGTPDYLHLDAANQPRQFYYVTAHDTE